MTFKYSIGDTVRHDDQEWLIVGAYRDNAPLYLAPRDRGPWYRLERRGAHSSVTCKVQESQLQPQYAPTCPAPLKVGDKVRRQFRPTSPIGSVSWTILHIDGDRCWMKRDGRYTTAELKYLVREPPRPIQVGDTVRAKWAVDQLNCTVLAISGGYAWLRHDGDRHSSIQVDRCELVK